MTRPTIQHEVIGYANGRAVLVARCTACGRDARGPRLRCAAPDHVGPRGHVPDRVSCDSMTRAATEFLAQRIHDFRRGARQDVLNHALSDPERADQKVRAHAACCPPCGATLARVENGVQS